MNKFDALARVAHVGVALSFHRLPIGGCIDGTIRAAEMNVGRASDKTIVIPGHGAAGGKAQLNEFRDMLVAIRDKVAALKKKGCTLTEVVAAKPTSAHDEKVGHLADRRAIFFLARVRRRVRSARSQHEDSAL